MTGFKGLIEGASFIGILISAIGVILLATFYVIEERERKKALIAFPFVVTACIWLPWLVYGAYCLHGSVSKAILNKEQPVNVIPKHRETIDLNEELETP